MTTKKAKHGKAVQKRQFQFNVTLPQEFHLQLEQDRQQYGIETKKNRIAAEIIREFYPAWLAGERAKIKTMRKQA